MGYVIATLFRNIRSYYEHLDLTKGHIEDMSAIYGLCRNLVSGMPHYYPANMLERLEQIDVELTDIWFDIRERQHRMETE